MTDNETFTDIFSAPLIQYDLLYGVSAAYPLILLGIFDQDFMKMSFLSISIIDKISALTNLIANFDPFNSRIKRWVLRVK